MNKQLALVLCVCVGITQIAGAQAASANDQAAFVLYQRALQEMTEKNYENAARNWEELAKRNSASYAEQIPFYQGQTYYYLGRYNEAIVRLSAYRNSTKDITQSAEALYWIGECLFAMGQLDRAKEVFSQFIEQYAGNNRAAAVQYRLDLIAHKKIEEELLRLLQASHEEALRSVGKYQKQERFYDQTINNLQQTISNLQKQIADISKDSVLSELEASNAAYQSRIAEYEARIASLEAQIKEANLSSTHAAQVQSTPDQRMNRLLRLKQSAQALELAIPGGPSQ
ncbi:MAG: tetratricopeptide repeat protein [Spirochaetaceae bacterium]|jgi:outer membrane protein assembly factor BamD (BamD/ComL family)|nr:tetratricopeptide repeat protein [Spirochaetaceae bacterium]